MTRPAFIFLASYLVILTVQLPAVHGQELRSMQRIERQPVAPQRIEETERTVYRDRIVTEMRDSYRPVYSPVTEYHMEPRWHNWWNPFRRPYVAYHMRPRTHWEARYQRYQTPVTFREAVPVTEKVRVVRRELGFVEREVVDQVVVEPSRRSRVANLPSLTGSPVGPVYSSARVYNDPPRQSTSTRY